jgi:hypothetical protein
VPAAAKAVVEERLRRLDDEIRAAVRTTANTVDGESEERERVRLALVRGRSCWGVRWWVFWGKGFAA